MQLQHRCLVIVLREERPHVEAARDRVIDQRLLLRARGMQYIVDDFLFRSRITRMPYADPQPPEVPAAQAFRNVLQAIVPAGPAAEFQARHSRREIEFVIHHQNLKRLYLVKRR